jgi:hypothetical protein
VPFAPGTFQPNFAHRKVIAGRHLPGEKLGKCWAVSHLSRNHRELRHLKAGLGSGVQLEFKFLRAFTSVGKLKIRGGLGFMKEHLLSLVLGRQGHFRLESGHHGDLWFQLETLCLHSREIRPFAVRLADISCSIKLKWYVVRSSRSPLPP